MRFVQLVCPEGACYVDVSTVTAIGPVVQESVGGRTVALRAVYLMGGQCLAVIDGPDNMTKLIAGGARHDS